MVGKNSGDRQEGDVRQMVQTCERCIFDAWREMSCLLTYGMQT